jgi:hypothetical protein
MTFRTKRILVVGVVVSASWLVVQFGLLKGWILGILGVVVGLVWIWCELDILGDRDRCMHCGCERPSGSPSLVGGLPSPRLGEVAWICPECGRSQGFESPA